VYPSKCDVLYDQTSGANAALDTGILNTGDYDFIGWNLVASAAITASTMTVLMAPTVAGPTIADRSASLTAGQSVFSGGWGPGCAGAVNACPAIERPVPPAVQVQTTAAGVGVTLRLIIYGRRNFRGSVPNTTTRDGITPRALD